MPPNSNVASYEALSTTYLIELSTDKSPIIIAGDFDLPDINWSTLSATSQASNLFCDLVYDLNLTQLTATHIHGNILDLMLTNIEESIHNVQIYPHNYQASSSDHFLISIDIHFHS